MGGRAVGSCEQPTLVEGVFFVIGRLTIMFSVTGYKHPNTCRRDHDATVARFRHITHICPNIVFAINVVLLFANVLIGDNIFLKVAEFHFDA